MTLAWDWEAFARRAGASPDPIKVQGITVRSGDPVVLMFGGRSIRRTYVGVLPSGAIMLDQQMTTAQEMSAGPWGISDLRHPDILEGIIKEIDAGE